jgi:hypothetical protein
VSTARAQRHLLERLAAGATVLLVLLLDLLGVLPAWADGQDAEGRAVLLVGRHQLGTSDEATRGVARVLAMLRAGTAPDGVHAIAYAPKASSAFAEIVAGESAEVLVDGPRGTGKTMMTPAALGGLAELHARAGFAAPMRCLWLHDSLTSASAKTARSLEAALWGGLWQARDDRKVAALTIGGADLVVADFVGVGDPTAAERLKAECHVLVAEEVVPSLTEGGGVDERSFELAITSMRLPTRRRVAVAVTNPGAPDSWPALRFGLEGALGKPGSVRCAIPASDRLTADEQTALLEAFRDSPDLRMRLARGEWAELLLGATVTPGFRDEHIAPAAIPPVPNVPLGIGWDGGHTPTAVIGSSYQGAVLIHAALSAERAGTRQLIEQYVKPWLALHAPWCLAAPNLLRHWVDPSMATGEQGDIDQDPVQVIRKLLGGSVREGAVKWTARLEPGAALLERFNVHTGRPTLQIDPVGGLLLIRALRGRWYFPTVHGQVSRDLPVKNHPWSDVGDSFLYLIGGLAPSRGPSKPYPPYAASATSDTYGDRRHAERHAESSTRSW